METEQTATGAVEAAEPITAPEPAAPSIDETLNAAYDEATREPAHRDEAGRFASKNPPAESAETATAETKTPDTAKPATDGSDKVAPPEGWSDAAKVDWNRLPRSVQQAIAEKAASHSAPDPALAEQVKRYEPIGKALEQYRHTYESRGLDGAQAVATLLDVQAQLDKDPYGTLQKIAELYRIDLRSLAGQQPEAGAEAADPKLTALENELRQVKSTLTGWANQHQRAQSEAAQGEIEAFKKDRPHFDQVRRAMGVLMQNGLAKDLADAYDRATNADPQIRQSILAEQRKADEAKAKEEADKRAAEAKRQKSINVRTGQGTTPNAKQTIEDTLSDAYDRAQTRAA